MDSYHIYHFGTKSIIARSLEEAREAYFRMQKRRIKIYTDKKLNRKSFPDMSLEEQDDLWEDIDSENMPTIPKNIKKKRRVD